VTLYLCWTTSYGGRWILTQSLCDAGTDDMVMLAANDYEDIVDNSFYVADGNSNSFTLSSAVISDCSQGFRDLTCLEDSPYGDELCVHSNETLWSGGRTFSVSDELCSNDKPVYSFTLYNDSNTLSLGDGLSLGRSVESVYYLHFQLLFVSAADENATGMWMLSKDQISIDYLAVCELEDLMECTANVWRVQITYNGGEDQDALVLRVIDEFMNVQNGNFDELAVSNSNENGGDDEAMMLILVVVLISVFILCCIGCFVWRRMKRPKIEQSFQKPSADVHAETASAEKEEEVDPEIEVEVSFDRKLNQTAVHH